MNKPQMAYLMLFWGPVIVFLECIQGQSRHLDLLQNLIAASLD